MQSIARNSEETTELKSLSPLIGGDAESPEVDAAPVEQNLPADEHVSLSPTQSAVVRTLSPVPVLSFRPIVRQAAFVPG